MMSLLLKPSVGISCRKMTDAILAGGTWAELGISAWQPLQPKDFGSHKQFVLLLLLFFNLRLRKNAVGIRRKLCSVGGSPPLSQ